MDNVTTILAFLTVVGQLLILFLVIPLLFNKKKKTPLLSLFKRRATSFAFIVSLIAMSGSLYFSNIADLTPCLLCWWQRIFMFPQVLILGLATLRKETCATFYALAMSIVGALIAGYHYYIQITNNPLAPCSTAPGGLACTDKYFTVFGYISIPLMALTAFLLIIVFCLIATRPKHAAV